MLIKLGEFDDVDEAAPHDEEDDREKTDTVLFDDSAPPIRCERSLGEGAPDDVVETDEL